MIWVCIICTADRELREEEWGLYYQKENYITKSNVIGERKGEDIFWEGLLTIGLLILIQPPDSLVTKNIIHYRESVGAKKILYITVERSQKRMGSNSLYEDLE